jgi:hypothetical protein
MNLTWFMANLEDSGLFVIWLPAPPSVGTTCLPVGRGPVGPEPNIVQDRQGFCDLALI